MNEQLAYEIEQWALGKSHTPFCKILHEDELMSYHTAQEIIDACGRLAAKIEETMRTDGRALARLRHFAALLPQLQVIGLIE